MFISWLIGIALIVASIGWAILVWFANMNDPTGTHQQWTPALWSIAGIIAGACIIYFR